MSFRDIEGSKVSRRRVRAKETPIPHIIRATPPPEEQVPARPRVTHRPIVLHGRVQTVTSTDSSVDSMSISRGEQNHTSIRTELERKSVFAQLSHETLVFQKMVADLESLMSKSGETPEAAWRTRILIRSAQETDKALWDKLYQYERSLHGKPDSELRQTQTACMKLHRDFKRVHKALGMTLSLHEKRQKAEVSRLGAVGWSEVKEDEDFFDRAMREREQEVNDMYVKMNSVSDIYKDLAALVESQQEKIDTLGENTGYSKANVEAATSTPMFFCGTAETLCSPLGESGGFECTDGGNIRVDDETLVFEMPDLGWFDSREERDSTPGGAPLTYSPARRADGLQSRSTMRSAAYDGSQVDLYDDDSDSDDSPIAIDPEDDRKDDGWHDSNDSSNSYQREVSESYVGEVVPWMLPFETFSDDVQAVQRELFGSSEEAVSRRKDVR